jgi:hypothetical protein
MRNGPLTFATLLVVLIANALFAQSTDERFLEGLRERQLFELAESFCRQQLAKQSLTDQARARLTREFIRTAAARAVHLPPGEREPVWRSARTIAAEFERDHPNNPRQILVRTQDALVVLSRAELARIEAEVGAAGAPAIAEARGQIREAIRLLGDLEVETATMIRAAHRDRPDAAELSADDLISLQNNLRYQLARAYRNQALCYAADSDDRISALLQAIRTLDPLTRLTNGDPMMWRARVDLIVCLRQLGRWAEAAARIADLEKATPPVEIQLRGRAERIRLELGQGRPEKALAMLQKGRSIDGRSSAELDFAMLEVFLACWKAAAKQEKPQQAEEWQKKAAQMVKSIEQLHGDYWLRRAQARLALAARGGVGADGLDVLVMAAENYYRRGELEDAAKAYDRAGQHALDHGKLDQAFDLKRIAGVIEHKRKNLRGMIDRFRAVALAIPQHEQAAATHWFATRGAADLAKRQHPIDLTEYLALVDEHVETWPSSPTADEARWWRGTLAENRREWSEAIAAYQAIAPNFKAFDQAVAATERCWRARLRKLEEADRQAEAVKAAEHFENIVRGGGDWPTNWSPAQRIAATAAAGIRLQYIQDGYADAAELLEAATARATDADNDWLSSARALYVVSLAGGGDARAATSVMREISTASPDSLLAMLTGLETLSRQASEKVRQDLAPLELTAVKLLREHEDKLTTAQKDEIARVRGLALATTGKMDEANDIFSRLVKADPKNADLRQEYAAVLTQSGDEKWLRLGLDQWRLILRNIEPKTPLWYRARYQVALAHHDLGEKDEAAKVIRYLKILSPDLGGPEMKARFLTLLEKCQR